MPKLPRPLEQLELYHQPERIPDWKALPETVREEVLRNLTRMFGIDGSEWLRIRKREGRGMSDKIKAHHLNRNAVLYVRQSSKFQVTHDEETDVCNMPWSNGFEI